MSTQLTLLTISLIVIVYMPGYLFKRFYFSGKFHKQFKLGEFTERFITTIFWGIIIQVITYQIANSAFHLEEKNFLKFVYSAYGKISGTQEKRDPNPLPLMPFAQCLYYLGLSFFLAAAAGKLFHKIVRIFQLDVRSQVLRFSNDWHYILRGEEMKNIRDRNQMIVSTEMDIMAQNLKGDSLLYSGILKDYVVSSTSEDLDIITLTGAKHISVDGTEIFPINGDTFVIPYAHVKNINIRFNKKKKPKFIVGNKEYSRYVLWIIQSLYAVIFFSFPFYIFYHKFKSGLFIDCLLSSLFLCCSWLFVGVIIVTVVENYGAKGAERRAARTNIIQAALGAIFAALFGVYLFYNGLII